MYSIRGKNSGMIIADFDVLQIYLKLSFELLLLSGIDEKVFILSVLIRVPPRFLYMVYFMPSPLSLELEDIRAPFLTSPGNLLEQGED